MTLARGTRLGAFEIVAPLGAGGMGEVYRAHDARLGRDVALKVLAPGLTADSQGRARLEREARAVAAMSHPHIGALFDVGEHDGSLFLVLELLEGETLAERLTRGPLLAGELLRVGREVAAALAHAHRAGVVHRDLKPGNVMLTKSGAKLLDFGLARPETTAVGVGVSGEAETALPAAGLTAEGSLVGTVLYMAPEQLIGRSADARTDVFALGTLLYEAATGRRAFDATSTASLIAAILEREPAPMRSVQPLAPTGLDAIVDVCLAKDPDARWQSAADVGLALAALERNAGSTADAAPPPPSRRRRAVSAALAGAALVLAAAGGWLLRRTVPPPLHASLVLPATVEGSKLPELSPDGRTVLWSSHGSDTRDPIWIRGLADAAPRPLAGTEGATFAFWSADGSAIGYFAGRKLYRVDLAGGPPTALCEAPDQARGGAWNREGVILFAPGRLGGLVRVDARGGTPAPVTTLDARRGDTTHRWPQFLPDGRHFLYWASPNTGEGTPDAVFWASLDGGEPRSVVSPARNAVYAGGRLFWTTPERRLLAQRFDPDRGVLAGTPEPVVDGVATGFGVSRAAFSVAGDTVVYFTGHRLEHESLQWWSLREGGRALGEIPSDHLENARVAPDGIGVALSIYDPETRRADIWLLPDGGSRRQRVTFTNEYNWSPVWSPDGSRLFYLAGVDNRVLLIARNGRGGGEETVVADLALETRDLQLTDVGADAAIIQAWNPRRSTFYDLYRVDLATGAATPFLAGTADERDGRFSPDGRWVAFASDLSGRTEIYLSDAAGRGRWQATSTGGVNPQWSDGGRRIVYYAPGGALEAVGVAFVDGEPRFDEPVTVVAARPTLELARYDLVPSADRLLVGVAPRQAREYRLLVGWPQLLH